MKKTVFTLLAAAVLTAGCATTGTTTDGTATTTAKTITLEQALQKSAETRQKLLEAKQAYQNAQNAAAVAAGTKTAADVAKELIENKIDSAKQQLADEKAAWEELLGTN